MNSTSRLESQGSESGLWVTTLGGFRVRRDGHEIEPTAWGREKALFLFQYLLTNRHKQKHKEQIIAELWPDLDQEAGDRDFKVALNAINKAIEPERAARAQPRYIQRFDLAYSLDLEHMWVDVDNFESNVAAGNKILNTDPEVAIAYYQSAVDLYQGQFLPERRYEDWTSAERERLEILALSTMTGLAELHLPKNPRDSLRLTQFVISQEPLWEEAYRIQMQAFQALSNRSMALKTYQKCRKILDEEFGIEPLPKTKSVQLQILVAEK